MSTHFVCLVVSRITSAGIPCEWIVRCYDCDAFADPFYSDQLDFMERKVAQHERETAS